MSPTRHAGRTAGLLMFVHLVTGLTLPYILLQSMTGPVATVLANAADLSFRVRLSVAMLFVGGAVPIAISIVLWPTIRERSSGLGLWLLTLAGVNLALQAVENQHWLSMLSIGEEYRRAGTADAAFMPFVAATVRSAWRWAHYSHLLAAVSWLCLLFAGLFRLSMVPRALAAAGVVTTLMQIGGITLPVLLNYRVPLRMEFWGMPLGITYLVLSVWVMTKGVRQSGV